MLVDWAEENAISKTLNAKEAFLLRVFAFAILYSLPNEPNPRSGSKFTLCIKLCLPSPHGNVALVQSNFSLTKVFYIRTFHVVLVLGHTLVLIFF